MIEEWRRVPSIGEFCEASNMGNIRILPRSVACANGRARRRGSRTLSKRPSGKGYRCVNISVLGASKTKYVHRLVYEAFHGRIPHGLEVNHIDGNRENNAIENLEICTRAQNAKHASRVLMKNCGARHRSARLSDDSVRAILELLGNGVTSAKIAGVYGVTRGCIKNIKLGLSWKHITAPNKGYKSDDC